MRWLYISPHLDDAVLSCGGLIQEQTFSKISVEIWTVCAGDPPDGELSPFARYLHEEWGTGSETPARRRAEDINACQGLGARHRHLPFPDCIYRQRRDGGWLYPDDGSIQGDLSPEDDATKQTLETFLSASLKPDDILICPLAVGKHVDHQLVRKTLERLNRSLLYFADIPYLFTHPTQLSGLTFSLQSELYQFPLKALESWQDAIQIYASQIPSLFPGLAELRESISGYYHKEQGIRLWKSI